MFPKDDDNLGQHVDSGKALVAAPSWYTPWAWYFPTTDVICMENQQTGCALFFSSCALPIKLIGYGNTLAGEGEVKRDEYGNEVMELDLDDEVRILKSGFSDGELLAHLLQSLCQFAQRSWPLNSV